MQTSRKPDRAARIVAQLAPLALQLALWISEKGSMYANKPPFDTMNDCLTGNIMLSSEADDQDKP